MPNCTLDCQYNNMSCDLVEKFLYYGGLVYIGIENEVDCLNDIGKVNFDLNTTLRPKVQSFCMCKLLETWNVIAVLFLNAFMSYR